MGLSFEIGMPIDGYPSSSEINRCMDLEPQLKRLLGHSNPEDLSLEEIDGLP